MYPGLHSHVGDGDASPEHVPCPPQCVMPHVILLSLQVAPLEGYMHRHLAVDRIAWLSNRDTERVDAPHVVLRLSVAQMPLFPHSSAPHWTCVRAHAGGTRRGLLQSVHNGPENPGLHAHAPVSMSWRRPSAEQSARSDPPHTSVQSYAHHDHGPFAMPRPSTDEGGRRMDGGVVNGDPA